MLILVENLPVPFDRRVWQESRALVEAGYQVVVICPAGTGRDAEPEVVLDGVRILRYPLRAATGGPVGYVREYGSALWHTLRLALRVRREGPVHVVQACNPPDLLFLAALPLMARGATFVFDHHDLVPELFRSRFPRGGRWLFRVTLLCERLTFVLAAGVISTNESYRQVAIDRGRKDPAVVQVVRSAPDLERFTTTESDPDLRRGKRHLAAYLGVMGPQDGIDYALRALAHLRHDLGRADLHTIFMGSGDCFDEVRELCTRLGLDDCVEFTGRVPDEFVQRCLSTADVCLAPDPRTPLNDVSSMNKIVEYMATGRPIVAFDLVEARVSAGGAAVYAPADDELAFAKCVDELLGDRRRREEMGEIGKARVAGELSWAHSRRNLTDFYSRIAPLPPSRGEPRGAQTGRGTAVAVGRIGWYATRARMMGPREVGWRIASAVGGSTRALGFRVRDAGVLDDATGSGWETAFRRFQDAADRPVVLDRARAAAIARELPHEASAVVRAADAVRDGTFAFFGNPPVRFPGRIDWNLDPRTGCRWPDKPAARINHRTHRGDAKWIWELNRLQHLPWLAQAWLFTGDDGYAEAALDQIDSWLDQNPTGHGIAWRGGFEAGLRAISVSIAVQGLRDAPAMTPERYRRIVTMLADSADLCWRDRSRFSSANNHLLGELAGAATVGILFPELAWARRWERDALAALAREADRQILSDGAGAEQSSAYLIFSAQLLLVPATLLALRGDQPPEAICAAVRRSAEYLADLVGDGDPLPRYGDEDGGFALRLNPDPIATLERHLALVAATTGGPWPASSDLPAQWLAPGGSREQETRPVRAGSWYAPRGGLVVLRRAQQRIMMDVGPLGYLALAAHGHADALAVTIAADGHDLVGDPGTGSYYAEPLWRTAFRRTRMHATVEVDRLDQSVAGGPFLWTRHAATSVRGMDLGRGVVEAEHDGYTRLDDPVLHRRYLVAPPDRDWVLVLDLLEGTGRHRFRTSWPLGPDLDVEAHGPTQLVTRAGVPVLQVASTSTAALDSYQVRGDDDEGLGWWSPSFESRVPAWLVGAVVEDAECPVVVATVLTVSADRDLRVEDLWVARDGSRGVDVTWTDGTTRAAVRVDTGTPGAVSFDVAVLA
ncbi:heparinase II/III domain-containing protein [Pseudonocardia sp. DLS-67]